MLSRNFPFCSLPPLFGANFCFVLFLALLGHAGCADDERRSPPADDDAEDQAPQAWFAATGERGEIALTLATSKTLPPVEALSLGFRPQASDSPWRIALGLRSPSLPIPPNAQVLFGWLTALDLLGEAGDYELRLTLHHADDATTEAFALAAIGNGLRFSPIRLDADLPAPIRSSGARLLRLANGRLAMVWLDGREGGTNVYGAVSPDGGMSWPGGGVRLDAGLGGLTASLPFLVAAGDAAATVWLQREAEAYSFYVAAHDAPLPDMPSPLRIGEPIAFDRLIDDITAAAFRDGVALAWVEGDNAPSELRVLVVPDAGSAAASAPQTVDVIVAEKPDLGDPALLVVNGTIHLVYRAGEKGTFCDLRHLSSADGGRTWNGPETLHTVVSAVECIEQPRLAALADGRLAAFSIQPLDAPAAPKGILRQIREAGGWSVPVPLTAPEAHPKEPLALVQDEGGNVALAWVDERDGYYGIFTLSLDAAGEPLAAEARADAGLAANSQSYSPRLAAAHGAFYVLWQNVEPNSLTPRLVFNQAAFGEAFGPPVILDSGPQLEALSSGYTLAVADSALVVAYTQLRYNAPAIVLKRSVDGQLWTAAAENPGETSLPNSHSVGFAFAVHDSRRMAGYLKSSLLGPRAFLVEADGPTWPAPHDFPGILAGHYPRTVQVGYAPDGGRLALAELEDAALGTAVVASFARAGGDWTETQHLNGEDEAELVQRQTRLIVSDDGPVVGASWLDIRDQSLYLLWRGWKDNDWGEEVVLNTIPGSPIVSENLVAYDIAASSEQIIEAWIGFLANTYYLVVAPIPNEGALQVASVISRADAPEQVEFDLAAGIAGRAALAYTFGEAKDARRLWLSRSTDGGETWDITPVAVANAPAAYAAPEILLAGDGRLVVLWWEANESARTLTLSARHSPAFGERFGEIQALLVIPGEIAIKGLARACMLPNGAARILVHVGEGEDLALRLLVSADAGATWTDAGLAVPEEKGGYAGRLHCQTDGGVDMLYGARVNGFTQLFYAEHL